MCTLELVARETHASMAAPSHLVLWSAQIRHIVISGLHIMALDHNFHDCLLTVQHEGPQYGINSQPD